MLKTNKIFMDGRERSKDIFRNCFTEAIHMPSLEDYGLPTLEESTERPMAEEESFEKRVILSKENCFRPFYRSRFPEQTFSQMRNFRENIFPESNFPSGHALEWNFMRKKFFLEFNFPNIS